MKSLPFKILSSPFFLLGLVLLLLNDFYLKQYFGNWFTGKLSDVSGLFIFPLFLTALFPKHKMASFIGTAIFFTFWKLSISNDFIAYINSFNIPIGRTVDVTDLFTLLMLPLAYRYELSNYAPLRIKPQLLIPISMFAFIATSKPHKETIKYVNINKTYEFIFPRDILVEKLNRITAEKISKLSKDVHPQFDSESDIVYSRWHRDTLAIFLDNKNITETDTIQYKTALADFVVKGNDSTSALTFINAYKVIIGYSDKEYREKTIKEFEKSVIKKLKKKN